MRTFGVISYILLAIITAYPAFISTMVYDSPHGSAPLKAYTVISLMAVPIGFFFGHLGFLPYPSSFEKKIVYLPLAALAHLIVFLILVSIFGGI